MAGLSYGRSSKNDEKTPVAAFKEASLSQINTDSPVLIPAARQQIRRPEVLDRVCSGHDAVTAANIGSTGIVVPSAYVPIARTGIVQSMP